MKKIISVLFLFCSCQNNKTDYHKTQISQTGESDVITGEKYAIINTFINELNQERSNKPVLLIDEFRKWDIPENLDFSIQGTIDLPKSEQERKKLLESKVQFTENPYPVIYVYAYPITDSLFEEKDRASMKLQARDTTSKILVNIPSVKFVDKTDSVRNKVSIAVPLISCDSSKAILNVYYNSFYHREIGYIGERQYVYYVKQGKVWKRIFATEKRLI